MEVVMDDTHQLEDVLALALQLPTGDRLRLVERVVVSVEHEISSQPPTDVDSGHWGQQLIALIDSLDLGEWEGDEDPVDWVKKQREQQDTRHESYWDGTQCSNSRHSASVMALQLWIV
jgi:hypothetical protein